VRVLQFSGGKDSLACLELLRPEWDDITVLWVNTGAAFPETENLMRALNVPHFLEVKSDQPSQIMKYGWPVDIVPVTHTDFGRKVEDHQKQLMQPSQLCCSMNIWQPMMKASKDLGATTIIRGQRNAEARKSPIRSGHIEDGIEYLFPIEDWTSQQVRDFLSETLPAHYAYVDTSLDCWDCTAYLNENVGKMHYMQDFHPEKYLIVNQRLKEIRHAVQSELDNLDAVI
jgi:3'-phosphoadenosine 5'-phosphosulfate sulfotransferase (PAPS reductase)/FAD synthetase